MVREPKCPAILIECGFMDSTVDTPMILTEGFAAKVAKGIAKGICKTAGLAWKDIEEEIDMTKDELNALIDERVEAKLATLTSISNTGDNPSEWAKTAVEWAKAQGIFTGDGAGNYGWKRPITREQVAQVLYNMQKK
jgi:hypothetical protein